MPSVTFEGETHGEIVVKVRRWLASVDGHEEGGLTAAEAVTQGAELTKDALRIIASAAPERVAQSDLVKGLTNMGYKATDATRSAVIAGLDSIEEMTGGGVVHQASDVGRRVVWQMNTSMAKQLLRSLRS